jgi:hypothetical protein
MFLIYSPIDLATLDTLLKQVSIPKKTKTHP